MPLIFNVIKYLPYVSSALCLERRGEDETGVINWEQLEDCLETASPFLLRSV